MNPRPSVGRSPCTTIRLAPCSRRRSVSPALAARRTRHRRPWRTRTLPRPSTSAPPNRLMQRMATGFRRCPARAGVCSCASIARWNLSSTGRGVRARSNWWGKLDNAENGGRADCNGGREVDAEIDRGAATKRCGVGAAVRSGRRQLALHLPNEMVDRGGIELPTSGFSVA